MADLVFLGDTHGNVRFVLAALEVFKRAGVTTVIQVGDFGVWPGRGGAFFLDKTDLMLEELGMTLIFCDGNHEDFDQLEAIPVDEDGFRRVRPNIWHAPRGHQWEYNGLRLGAMGGAHSIDGPGGVWQQARGPIDITKLPDYNYNRTDEIRKGVSHIDLGGWWPQETITRKQVDAALLKPPVDIMISHDCPARVHIPGKQGYPMGDRNRALLQQVVDAWRPQLLVCGHWHLRQTATMYHDDYNAQTRVEILDAENNDSYLLVRSDPFTVVERIR